MRRLKTLLFLLIGSAFLISCDIELKQSYSVEVRYREKESSSVKEVSFLVFPRDQLVPIVIEDPDENIRVSYQYSMIEGIIQDNSGPFVGKGTILYYKTQKEDFLEPPRDKQYWTKKYDIKLLKK